MNIAIYLSQKLINLILFLTGRSFDVLWHPSISLLVSTLVESAGFTHYVLGLESNLNGLVDLISNEAVYFEGSQG